ncbi:hypothetical protein [uncultured Methylobacterium sp.]|uniref:hypothetical protein n=1 Tax=uncultured Methylobacterium sp. TaxID=157278 RepID=UPI0026048EF7|nr:hypothetical protein [uncultured Methylobacterium sp.]
MAIGIRSSTTAKTRPVVAILLIVAGLAGARVPALGGTMTADEIAGRIAASPLKPEIGAIIDLDAPRPSRATADDYRIEPPGSRPFASDGAGGMFHLLPDGRILLIDSEGSFGVVASGFDEFVATATGLPSWRDALRFVGEPDLGRARAAWNGFVRRSGLDKELDGPWPYGSKGFSAPTPAVARRAIRSQWGIPASSDPFAALYHAVNRLSGDVSVSWQDDPLLLFGRNP